ncbi:hypothetical protein D1BOALGB6SA_3607 [Olavius sp. associated proteobacterium Delta 1]|nr:hypothetical protein D1BOALGB6SA_3607 [Olavius sp. associated proteobacterium Delta 1]
MPLDRTYSGLGGWSQDDLRSTLQEFSNVGSDFDIDETIRFIRGVVNVVRKRERIDEGNTDPRKLSVFLLAPDAYAQGDLPREPMIDSGMTVLAGKIWFVNAPVIAGKMKPIITDVADEIFRIVTDEINVGEVPAVVVDPRPPVTEVRYYHNGMRLPDDRISLRIDCSDITIQEICDIINRVYNQCLITPDAQPEGNKLWKNSSKFRPYRNAEHRVQAFLKPAFAGAFPTCRIYHESAGTAGRADLHIEEPDPFNRENVINIAVIELKVLRSYGETGSSYSDTNVREWIEEGIRQAYMYRKEKGHRFAALCCFDMRKTDNGSVCFEPYNNFAEEKNVELRRWYLYSSSKVYRIVESTTDSSSS